MSVQESELPASSAPSVASPRAPVEFDARQSMKAWRIEQPNLILDAEHGVSAMPAGYAPSMLISAVENIRKESRAHLAVGWQAVYKPFLPQHCSCQLLLSYFRMQPYQCLGLQPSSSHRLNAPLIAHMS